MKKRYALISILLSSLVLSFSSATAQYSSYGDANTDGYIDISDAVYLISYIFGGGPAPDPVFSGDANGDGSVDISDVVYLIQYIFAGGSPPKNFFVPPDSSQLVFDSLIGEYVAQNRIIVTFYDSVSRDTIDERIRALGATVVGEVREINQFSLEVSNPGNAIQTLLADSCVEDVCRDIWSRNQYGSAGGSYPNDPYFVPYLQEASLSTRLPLVL
jgi:hypothetical protein